MAHETETDLPLFLASPEADQTLEVLVGDDEEDIVFGRMPVGGAGDVSEFDIYPPDTIDLTEEQGEAFTTIETLRGDEFETPLENFPAFSAALRKFKSKAPKPRVVRIDTEESFTGLVADQAVKELERRVNELRSMFEAHVSDRHGGALPRMRKWDVIGAAEAVSDLHNAQSTGEALDAFPDVPVSLPPWAEGKIKCWRDGDHVMCSIWFQAADGSPRVATSAAKPRIDAEAVSREAIRAGIDPITVLGALPDVADSVCGKNLVRDIAGAALHAQRRLDICVMGDEPMLVASGGDDNRAPIAALMHVMQCADAGDRQCMKELAAIVSAARTPVGRQVAVPLLIEAKDRLEAARAKRKPSLVDRVKGWLR